MNYRKARHTVTLLLGISVLAASPSLGRAELILNPSLDEIGPLGSPVTTTGVITQSAQSAAAFWTHILANPSTFITTELLPSTNPLPGGGGNMLHVVTNGGLDPVTSFGPGVGTTPVVPPLLQAELSYDLFVVSGQVTGGFVRVSGPFADFSLTFGPTGGWIRVTQTWNGPERVSAGPTFETLFAPGAEYFLDNVRVTDPNAPPQPVIPEPGSAVLLAVGMALCGVTFLWRRGRVSKA